MYLAPSSIRRYEATWNQFTRSFQRDNGRQPSSYKELISWVIAKYDKNPVAPSTIKLFKSAILHRLRNPEDNVNEDISEAIALVNRWRPKTKPPERHRESRRSIPMADWIALYEYFTVRGFRSIWNARAQVMMMAGVYSGLRPIEWLSAQFIDVQTLSVRNAKRDRESTRTIFIEKEHVSTVIMQIENVNAFMSERFGPNWREKERSELEEYFSKYIARVRTAMWRACKEVFPDGRTYSPYDTRSTFAGIRKAKQGILKTAQELGHTVKVSQESYATPRKVKSWLKSLRNYWD